MSTETRTEPHTPPAKPEAGGTPAKNEIGLGLVLEGEEGPGGGAGQAGLLGIPLVVRSPPVCFSPLGARTQNRTSECEKSRLDAGRWWRRLGMRQTQRLDRSFRGQDANATGCGLPVGLGSPGPGNAYGSEWAGAEGMGMGMGEVHMSDEGQVWKCVCGNV